MNSLRIPHVIILIFSLVLIVGCATRSPIPSGVEVDFYPYEVNPLLPPEKVFSEVEKWLGVKYRYGANTPNSVDCSAFTRNVYWKLGWLLPRSSVAQSELGFWVGIHELQIGDLLFFDTNGNGRVSHVAIYLGNKKFAHASSSRGVIISNLMGNYYKRRFLFAKRMVW